jgi:metal-sulfur cluster biosynthetic enzyme
MLGMRVHLELSVRATPDWMNDEARLRELGYGRRDVEGGSPAQPRRARRARPHP